MTPTKFFTGRAIVFTALLIIGALVAGFYAFNSYIYNEKQGEPEPIVAENPEGEADPSRMTLDMKKWIWVSALFNDGREIKPARADAFSLTFDTSGRFSATTDCNSMGGSYTAGHNNTLVLSDIFMTKMFCQGSQEGDFASLLETTSGYHFTSKGELILDLKFDSGSAVFR